MMHAGKKSFTATKHSRNHSNRDNSDSTDDEEDIVHDLRKKSSSGSMEDDIVTNSAQPSKNNNSILKGLICDSPFASLLHLCEELVERARAQGVVVPGVVISVAIAMIARSVRNLAGFNIREITPIEDVPNIDVPALFVVGADDDFITPQHSERLVESYKQGVTTNLFMVPGGHNDARPPIVFEGILEFCRQRLSLGESPAPEVPPQMLSSIHQNPPWAYHRTVHFQAHSTREHNNTQFHRTNGNAAQDAAEHLGMTQERQDDIQNKIGLMMGGQGDVEKLRYSSDEENA